MQPCLQGKQQLLNLWILRLNLISVFTKTSLWYAYIALCPQSKLCQARKLVINAPYGNLIITAPAKKCKQICKYYNHRRSAPNIRSYLKCTNAEPLPLYKRTPRHTAPRTHYINTAHHTALANSFNLLRTEKNINNEYYIQGGR